jgi:hypothetical protein
LRANAWVRCDSSLGEVYVNPLNVLYVAVGKRRLRRTTSSAAGNQDHQRLVGGQSL